MIWYWLLLLIPTLAAGIFMLRLLRHDGERLALVETAAQRDRARALADNIALSVDDAKEGLLEALRDLPATNRVEALRAWERTNPLIRNVFLWKTATKALQYPGAAYGVTREQSGFIRRYADLFSGHAPWPAAPPAELAQPAASARQQLRALSKGAPAWKSTPADAPQPSSADHGWLTWYWEDELHLLGWLRGADGDAVCGLEIEMAALLSRLVASQISPAPPGMVYALLDGNGHVFAQRGGAEITSDMQPRAAAELSPQLPHWQVALYGAAPAAAGGSYAFVSALLVSAFVIAILSGGSLLLWQARRNLREAQQRTSFVANVSHELKTPLTTIRMYAEMLAEGRVTTDDKRHTYLEVITRESQRLTRLVNNVLDFSRLEQGRKQYRFERLELAAVARDVLESQADRLRDAGLALKAEFPESSAWILADRDALSQCLLNLLDNAIKYAAAGGQLCLRLVPDTAAWRLEMEDAGPGVPAAHRARLFEQFHRVDDSLTTRVAGFGLGLSISRRLLRDQGGDLSYEPATAGGARFVMRLPLAGPEPAAPAAGGAA